VTPVGLGLAALGRPAYITLHRDRDLGQDRSVFALRERAFEVLDTAFEVGIRYVDAARSYGRAEEFLSSWLQLRYVPPGELTVGSKWGYTYTAGWRLDAPVNEVKDHSLETFERQWTESFDLLGDRLNLYQIHSATLESGVLEDTSVMRALAGLREADVVAGLTVSGPDQADTIRRALDVRVDGVSPFGTVQATWNLLEPSCGPALAEAHEAGWGVLVKEAVANGRLAGLDAPASVVTTAARLGVSPDAVSIAVALAQPWVDVVLSGAVTPGQVRSNAAASTLDLSADEVAELSTLAEPPGTYWASRAALAWA
jgi:aryl-alcohol dehydrogenase-like predicted oxidoreductase